MLQRLGETQATKPTPPRETSTLQLAAFTSTSPVLPIPHYPRHSTCASRTAWPRAQLRPRGTLPRGKRQVSPSARHLLQAVAFLATARGFHLNSDKIVFWLGTKLSSLCFRKLQSKVSASSCSFGAGRAGRLQMFQQPGKDSRKLTVKHKTK